MTLLLAAGALGLFYLFFVPKPAPEAPHGGLPLSTEVGDDGYQAVWRWLQQQRIPVWALRRPYTDLDAPAADPTPARHPLARRGNLLITTMPHRVAARLDELNALEGWISRGNSVLVLAALDDTPQWAVATTPLFLRTLERMTRLRFEAQSESPPAAKDAHSSSPNRPKARDGVLAAMQRLLEPQRFRITGQAPHPLFAGVGSVVAVSPFPASRWRASALDSEPLIHLGRIAAERDPGDAEPAVWLKPEGAGQVLVFAVASPFSNAAVAAADNARLLSNIIAWSLDGGAVIFDDDHQGAASYYDAQAFFKDPRLHRSILWILLLWGLFVMGWQRLQPRTPAWNAPDATRFIVATGGFLAATLAPAAAAARMFGNFFDSVGLAAGGASPWERLATDARLPATLLAELKRLHARTEAGSSVDLARLHNLLAQFKGMLA